MSSIRPPIRYRYRDPDHPQLPVTRVEAIIRESPIDRGISQGARLGQLGDEGKRRPAFEEILFVLDDGLLALFRVGREGIPQEYSKVSVDTHAARQYGAFCVSHTYGFHLAPVSAERIHPRLGRGSLTAIMDAVSFTSLRMNEALQKQVPVMHADVRRHPTALAEAYVFDFLIGSGQRMASSHVVDKAGIVRSQYHHEAFSFTDRRRIVAYYRETSKKVSQAFWRQLQRTSLDLITSRLRGVLIELVGQDSTDRCFTTARTLLYEKNLEGETIHVLPEER